MENGHTNIAFSAYKDYQNLTTNDFAESKQAIWDMAKQDFHRTHKTITDEELCKFIKIYISHYVGEKHCYTSYQIVDPCKNISWDRDHKLYIDKDHEIVILESCKNYFGPLEGITEELLKSQEAAESKRCGFKDRLEGRTDHWLSAYGTWLETGKYGKENYVNDIEQFASKYNEEYSRLYDSNDKVEGFEEAVNAFNEYLASDPVFLPEFVAYREDFISSDREAAAFMFTMRALGIEH